MIILLYGIGSYILGVCIALYLKKTHTIFVETIIYQKEVKHTMSKVNLVNLASKIAKKEGLKKQVSIGNVREIMKLVFKELKSMSLQDIVEILKRYK